VPIGSQGFVTFLLDEILSQDMAHINDLLILGSAQVALGILFSFVAHQLLISLKQYFLLLLSYFFWWVSIKKLCRCVGHYGSKVMGLYSRPLSKALNPTIDLFWWYRPFNYGGLCPICFFRELGLVASYLCSKFSIFDRSILEEYVFQVEKGPHLFWSCFHAVSNRFPPATG